MKKPAQLALLMMFLLACSLGGLTPFGRIAPVDTPTESMTLTPTPTSTPTITLTPRNTPTRITDFLSQTPQIIIFPWLKTATPLPTASPSTPGDGFEAITISDNQIYWGICDKPRRTKMTVYMNDPEEVFRVYLFFRLKHFKKEDVTEWVGTVTDRKSTGTFTYELKANNVPGRKNYSKAWIQYQFVSVDEDEKILGRTFIYEKNILIQPCP